MGGALNDWTCGGEDGMQAWLAQPKVQAALHVSGHANSQMSCAIAPLPTPLPSPNISCVVGLWLLWVLWRFCAALWTHTHAALRAYPAMG